MNPTSPDEPSETGGDVTRRLEALRAASEPSVAQTSSDVLPNLPAQKLLVILSHINTNQVKTANAAASDDRSIQDELTAIKERLVSKDLLGALYGTHRDDLAKISDSLGVLHQQQQETAHRVIVAAVTLGVMLLGLAVLVALHLGGNR